MNFNAHNYHFMKDRTTAIHQGRKLYFSLGGQLSTQDHKMDGDYKKSTTSKLYILLARKKYGWVDDVSDGSRINFEREREKDKRL